MLHKLLCSLAASIDNRDSIYCLYYLCSKLTVVAIMFCIKAVIYGCISELQRHAYSPLTHQHKKTIHDTMRKLTRCRGVQDPSKLACTNKECGLSNNCIHMPIISSENGITHAQDDTSCLTIKLLGNMKLTKRNLAPKMFITTTTWPPSTIGCFT